MDNKIEDSQFEDAEDMEEPEGKLSPRGQPGVTKENSRAKVPNDLELQNGSAVANENHVLPQDQEAAGYEENGEGEYVEETDHYGLAEDEEGEEEEEEMEEDLPEDQHGGQFNSQYYEEEEPEALPGQEAGEQANGDAYCESDEDRANHDGLAGQEEPDEELTESDAERTAEEDFQDCQGGMQEGQDERESDARDLAEEDRSADHTQPATDTTEPVEDNETHGEDAEDNDEPIEETAEQPNSESMEEGQAEEDEEVVMEELGDQVEGDEPRQEVPAAAGGAEAGASTAAPQAEAAEADREQETAAVEEEQWAEPGNGIGGQQEEGRDQPHPPEGEDDYQQPTVPTTANRVSPASDRSSIREEKDRTESDRHLDEMPAAVEEIPSPRSPQRGQAGKPLPDSNYNTAKSKELPKRSPKRTPKSPAKKPPTEKGAKSAGSSSEKKEVPRQSRRPPAASQPPPPSSNGEVSAKDRPPSKGRPDSRPPNSAAESRKAPTTKTAPPKLPPNPAVVSPAKKPEVAAAASVAGKGAPPKLPPNPAVVSPAKKPEVAAAPVAGKGAASRPEANQPPAKSAKSDGSGGGGNSSLQQKPSPGIGVRKLTVEEVRSKLREESMLLNSAFRELEETTREAEARQQQQQQQPPPGGSRKPRERVKYVESDGRGKGEEGGTREKPDGGGGRAGANQANAYQQKYNELSQRQVDSFMLSHKPQPDPAPPVAKDTRPAARGGANSSGQVVFDDFAESRAYLTRQQSDFGVSRGSTHQQQQQQNPLARQNSYKEAVQPAVDADAHRGARQGPQSRRELNEPVGGRGGAAVAAAGLDHAGLARLAKRELADMQQGSQQGRSASGGRKSSPVRQGYYSKENLEKKTGMRLAGGIHSLDLSGFVKDAEEDQFDDAETDEEEEGGQQRLEEEVPQPSDREREDELDEAGQFEDLEEDGLEAELRRVQEERASVQKAMQEIKQAISESKNHPFNTMPRPVPAEGGGGEETDGAGPVWVLRPVIAKRMQYEEEVKKRQQIHDEWKKSQQQKLVRESQMPETEYDDEKDVDDEPEENQPIPVQGYRKEESDEEEEEAEGRPLMEADSGGLDSQPAAAATNAHVYQDRHFYPGPQHPSPRSAPPPPLEHDIGAEFQHHELPMSGNRAQEDDGPHDATALTNGIIYPAAYLGSTQLLSTKPPNKKVRMQQAQEAVLRIKAPDGETQPSTDVDLFISTERIKVLNADTQRYYNLQETMMDHPLQTISYIADMGNILVVMARRRQMTTLNEAVEESGVAVDGVAGNQPRKIICHVFESEDAQLIAQSIGQAFSIAYVEFLKANGIDDPSASDADYTEVLNSQEIYGDDLLLFSNKECEKELLIEKERGEIMGLVVVESGWGSLVPTVVIANMSQFGAAARTSKLNIGDQIMSINGASMVGLPLPEVQQTIKSLKSQCLVKFNVVSCPPVTQVLVKRPDTKYQLGFSVQNGTICSLMRGGIAERGGVRVGHRIIEINGTSVVATAHERIVEMLGSAVGEIRMKTMPLSMYRLLTGQETPIYL